MMGRKKAVRWWPLVLAAVALGIYLAWMLGTGERAGQDRVEATLIGGVLFLLWSVLWLALLSRLPWRTRVLYLLIVGALGFALVKSVRVRGVSGDLMPILGWRWSSGPGRSEALPTTGSASSLLTSQDLQRFSYPQFLGPTRNARVAGVELERDWTTNPPQERWRRPVGEAWSAFAIAAGLAITQEQDGDDETVVAYDLGSGEVRWVHRDPVRYETTIGGIGPRATPSISGDLVYSMGAKGLLNALDLATGERAWSRQVLDENGANVPEWGKSSSPLVVDDLVVVSVGGSEGRSLVAYNRKSGDPVWSAGDSKSWYSSPFVATLAGARQIVILNQPNVTGHRVDTGEIIWSYDWPSDQPNVAQPVQLSSGRLLVSSGYGVGSKLLSFWAEQPQQVSLKVSAEGIPELVSVPVGNLIAELVWESPRLKAKFANFVEHDGYIYGLDDGTMVCLDPDTGERCWKRGRYGHGQMILAGDLLIVQTEQGDIVLIDPQPDRLVELHRFTALEGKSWNSPALAGNLLLVRNDHEAVCYELPLAG
ncbi:MAG: PQQ-binding-like beta-propeller repeat protein [Thermoanaerobaculia bacterium]